MPPTRRLSRTWRIAAIWLCILLSTLAVPPAARAQAPIPADPGFQVTLLAEDATSIVLELTVDRYATRTVIDGAKSYTAIDIPGMAAAAPDGAPSHGAWLAVPTPAGASVTVLSAQFDTLAGTAPPMPPSPAALPATNLLDPTLPGPAEVEARSTPAVIGDGAPVAIAGQATVRSQALLHLIWRPVQYDAARHQIRVARRIRAVVRWDGLAVAATGQASAPDPWFDPLLRDAVLNPGAVAGALPAAAVTATATDDHPALPVKLTITADGVYALSPDDLAAAGIDFHPIDPRTLKLCDRGRELDIWVEGQEDGRFDAADRLFFYGQGIPITAPEAVYTGENVYWLGWGDAAGRRMAVRDGTPDPALPAVSTFVRHVHAEADTAYWQTMPTSAGDDRWFWGGRLSPNTAGLSSARTYVLDLPRPAAAAHPVHLRVRLQGYTAGAHRTRLSVNGSPVGERSWQGQAPFELSATLSQTLLRHGDNQVVVEALDSGAAVDQVLVDWIQVDYSAQFTATGDRLEFSAPGQGRRRFELAGFSQPDVLLFDITEPAAPARLVDAAVAPAAGSYTLALTTHTAPGSAFLALTQGQVRRPDRIELDRPSNWRSPQNGADYVLITHSDFYTGTLALAAHRQAQGLRVAVVKVDDLYDEFAGGLFDPAALRAFLAYAYVHWTPPAPSFVVLVGDAYQDYRDRLGWGLVNYVPSQIVDTSSFGEVSSDTWFASVVGDDVLPDMWVGRLPARTAAEVNAMVQKLIAYDSAPAAAWNRNVLLIADDDDPVFGQITDDLAAQLPVDYTRTHIRAADYGPGDPTVDIQAALNLGAALATYVGHGEYFRWGVWSGGVIFDTDDVDRLDNPVRLPVISVANCLSGFYAGPAMSIAEEFVLYPHGGAVAVWAPGSLGHPAGHRVLMGAFYAAIFRDDQSRLGPAMAAAQMATLAHGPSWVELVQTYALLGDPATALRLAPNPPRITAVEPPDGAAGTPRDAPLRVAFSKRMDPAALTLAGLDGLAPSFTWNHTGTELRVDHADFAPGRTYALAVDGADGTGAQLATGSAGRPWRVSVSPDDKAPSLSVAFVQDAGGAISPSAPISLTFSEPVRQGQVQVEVTPPPGEPANGEEMPAWELRWIGVQQAEIEHAALSAGVRYTLTVDGVQDLAGNRMSGPAVVSFTPGANNSDPALYIPFVTN